MHWAQLRKMCLEQNLDISGIKGKDEYIKLLQGNGMQENVESKIITTVTPDLLKSVGISEEGLKIDKLRSDLNSLRVPMRIPGRGIRESRFGNKVSYSIDTEDQTIHFLGGCLGPICTTLQQPVKVVLKIATHYLGTFTYDAGRAKHIAGKGHEDDERNEYLDEYN